MSGTEFLSATGLNVMHSLGYLFAIFGSFVAWILLVIWLCIDENGGLGLRDSSQLTAGYFNWHPFCMSFAFILMLFSSVLSFELSPFAPRVNQHLHWICHTISFIIAIAGLAIVLDAHLVLTHKGFLNSIHGVLGMITLSLFIINYIHGLMAYLLRRCDDRQCGCCGSDPASTSIHKRIGLMVVIGSSCNILIGMSEVIERAPSETSKRLGQAVAVILFLALSGLVSTLVRFQSKREDMFEKEEVEDWRDRWYKY